jgi:hypothetical protein
MANNNATMNISKAMMCHDLSKWTILSLVLMAATLIVGLIILVTKYYNG